MALIALPWLIYLALLAVLRPVMGFAAAPLSLLCSILTGWYFGRQVGIWSGLWNVLVNFTGYYSFWSPDTPMETLVALASALPGGIAAGLAGGLLGYLRELRSRLVDQQRQLTYQATHDALTGLGNRRAFDTALDAAWATRGTNLAVVLLDLDGFKSVNDLQGHAAGDEVLRGFAQALREQLGTGTTAFRLGGDEYAVLCEVEDLTAVQVAVREAVIKVQQAGFVEIGASVGSATAAEASSGGALVRLADERMYQEKRGKPSRRTQVPA